MSEPVKIRQADAFNGEAVLVTLSDGRVLHVTLEQIMSTQPQVLPVAEEQEELDRSLPA